MTATFIQDGDSIDYTPTANTAAGAVVVQGDLVGVAKQPITASALGSLAVSGVFDFPKATGTSSAIATGVQIYWDAGNTVATADSATTNTYIGKTVKAASATETTVRARLSQ